MSAKQWNSMGKVISKRKYLFFVGSLLVLIFGNVSCSHRTEKAEEPEASVETKSVALVPSYLRAIGQEAEEVIALAGKGEWGAVERRIETISKTWEESSPQLAAEPASESINQVGLEIDRLSTFAHQKDRLATMQAANDLSRTAVDLFELYHPQVPIALERLDIAERQVLLDLESRKLEKAQISVDKGQGYWNQLKSTVIYHGGEHLADKFQVSLALQRDYLKAGKQDLLVAEVENGLEIIDMIGSLF